MMPSGRVYHYLDRRFPGVAVLLVLANIAVFIWQCSQGIRLTPFDEKTVQALFDQALEPNEAMQRATHALGSVPVEMVHGERLWAVFSAMFVHMNLYHITGNLVFFLIFAPLVEDRLGHLRFLALYLLTGVASDVGQALTDLTSTTYGVGASGAISGVAGAAFLLFPKEPLYTDLPITVGGDVYTIPIRVPTWLCLLSWLGYQVVSMSHQWAGAIDDSVAYACHVAGFAAGIGLALLFTPPSKKGNAPMSSPASTSSPENAADKKRRIQILATFAVIALVFVALASHKPSSPARPGTPATEGKSKPAEETTPEGAAVSSELQEAYNSIDLGMKTGDAPTILRKWVDFSADNCASQADAEAILNAFFAAGLRSNQQTKVLKVQVTAAGEVRATIERTYRDRQGNFVRSRTLTDTWLQTASSQVGGESWSLHYTAGQDPLFLYHPAPSQTSMPTSPTTPPAADNSSQSASSDERSRGYTNSQNSLPTQPDSSATSGASETEFTDKALWSVETSSTLIFSHSAQIYAATNAIDGDVSTAWCPDRSVEDGLGEWIKIQFPSVRTVTAVGLLSAYRKFHRKYGFLAPLNNRIQEFRLEFEDGSSFNCHLADDLDHTQRFELPSPVQARSVKIVIKSVYPSVPYAPGKARWKDTTVSEIQVWGRATEDTSSTQPMTGH